jgi:hypothetical protein
MALSRHPRELPPVLEEIVRVARATFPRRNIDRRMRGGLGSIGDDQLFAYLFPTRGGQGMRAFTCRPSGGVVSANHVTRRQFGNICSIAHSRGPQCGLVRCVVAGKAPQDRRSHAFATSISAGLTQRRGVGDLVRRCALADACAALAEPHGMALGGGGWEPVCPLALAAFVPPHRPPPPALRAQQDFRALPRHRRELWNAVSLSGDPIDAGERVEVVSVERLTLYVDRVPPSGHLLSRCEPRGGVGARGKNSPRLGWPKAINFR